MEPFKMDKKVAPCFTLLRELDDLIKKQERHKIYLNDPRKLKMVIKKLDIDISNQTAAIDLLFENMDQKSIEHIAKIMIRQRRESLYEYLRKFLTDVKL